MERRDPAVTIAADRVVAGIECGEVVPPPTQTPLVIDGLMLSNRLVAPLGRRAGEALALTDTFVGGSDRAKPPRGTPRRDSRSTKLNSRDGASRGGGHRPRRCPSLDPSARARSRSAPPDRRVGDPGMFADSLHTRASGPTVGDRRKTWPRSVAAFGAAAEWAARTGFALLMVDAARGGLLAGFLSPVTNQRGDRYGGDVGSRLLFPLEVIEAVRRRLDWSAGGSVVGDRLDRRRLRLWRTPSRSRPTFRLGRCLARRGRRRGHRRRGRARLPARIPCPDRRRNTSAGRRWRCWWGEASRRGMRRIRPSPPDGPT